MTLLKLKRRDMKKLGILLIVAGIAMILIRGFSVPTEKKILELGPVEVNKTVNKWIGWPTYAGFVIGLFGILLISTERKISV
jgi:drug/metabolite transporter (DMT)-like permease